MKNNDKQILLDYIENEYGIINDSFRIELIYLCCIISKCFWADNTPWKEAKPEEMLDLLYELFHLHCIPAEQELVKTVTITDDEWEDWMSNFWPTKFRTWAHTATLITVLDEWVYCIGYNLLGVDHDFDADDPLERVKQRMYWVKDEWECTRALLDKLRKVVRSGNMELCKVLGEKDGVNPFEAIALCGNSSYDESKKRLENRHRSFSDVHDNIDKSISFEFFRESLTLQEGLFKDRLHSFLKFRGVKTDKKTAFVKLIISAREFTMEEHLPLLNDLDKWRKKRNDAIHFEETLSDGSREEYELECKKSAVEGKRLTKLINEWYEKELHEFGMFEV